MNDGSRGDDSWKPPPLPEGLFELHPTLDALQTFIYVKDRNLRVVSANQAFCDALGVCRSDLLGQLTSPYLGDAGPQSDLIDRDVIISGVPRLGVVETYPSPGGVRWVVTDKAPVRGSNGEIVGLVGTSIDITEQREAEEERYRTEQHLSFLTAHMADILWTADLELRTTFVTPSVTHVLGFTPEELEHRILDEMVPPESAAKLREEVRRQMEIEESGTGTSDGTMTLKVELYRKDGSTLWTENVVSEIRSADGVLTGFVGVSRDISSRVAAELALKQSDELLRAAELLSRVGGWSYDVATGHLVWTRGVFDIYELPEDATSLDVDVGLAGYPVESQEVIASAFRTAVARGVPYDLELPFVTARGVRKWVRTVAHPQVEHGRVVRVIGNIMDITDSREAAGALAESEAKYRALFELSKDAAYIVSSHGWFLEVNDAWIDMFGYTREEVERLRAEDVYEDPRLREECFLPLMARDGAVTNWEIRFKKRDGEVMDCLCNVVTRRDLSGEIISYQGLVRDITREKVAERTLRESERRFRTLSENLQDGVVRFDPSLQIVYANAAAERIMNMTQSLPPGGPAPDLRMPDEMRDRWEATLQGVRDSGMMRKGQCEIDTPSGSMLLDWRMIPERGSDGLVGSILLSLRDVTDLHRAQEQLRRLAVRIQEAREEERAAIARDLHDNFSQELTALKFDLDSLERVLAPGHGDGLSKLRRIAAMVDQMSLGLRQVISEMRPGMLDDLGLCAALEWQASQFSERTGILCALRLEAPDTGVPSTLATSLYRIVQELLANVSRHSGASCVHVNLTSDGRSLCLVVRDNGRGITPDELSDVTSLGILGIRERIRACGGTVDISGVPDEGTTVTVRVPIQA